MSCMIRKSTDQDLRVVLDWLKKGHDEAGEDAGSFWHNRVIIRKDHEIGDMHVVVDEGVVVAFFCGPAPSPNIMEVRPDMRGRGYGRMAAEKCIELARNADVCVMKIQCQPESSIPFWERMGFTLFEGHSSIYSSRHAYLIINRNHELPEGVTRDVVIDFLSQRAMYENGVLPFDSVHLTGTEDRSGVINLPERAICFSPSMASFDDPVVRITVDGKQMHFTKAKYPESRQIGIARGPCYTFYIDRICLPR